MLSTILDRVVSYRGVLIVRGDKFTPDRDIHILISFSQIENLADYLVEGCDAAVAVCDRGFEEVIAHCKIAVHKFDLDVFACGDDYCYLSPADFDVNTLTWNGTDYSTWFRFDQTYEEYYGHTFSVDDIIGGYERKEAIFLSGEYGPMSCVDSYKERWSKLENKDWIIRHIL